MDGWSPFRGGWVRSLGDYELSIVPVGTRFSWSIEKGGRVIIKSGAGFSGTLEDAALFSVEAVNRLKKDAT